MWYILPQSCLKYLTKWRFVWFNDAIIRIPLLQFYKGVLKKEKNRKIVFQVLKKFCILSEESAATRGVQLVHHSQNVGSFFQNYLFFNIYSSLHPKKERSLFYFFIYLFHVLSPKILLNPAVRSKASNTIDRQKERDLNSHQNAGAGVTSLRQSSCQIPRLEICERGEGNKKKQLKARSVVEYIMVSFRLGGGLRNQQFRIMAKRGNRKEI